MRRKEKGNGGEPTYFALILKRALPVCVDAHKSREWWAECFLWLRLASDARGVLQREKSKNSYQVPVSRFLSYLISLRCQLHFLRRYLSGPRFLLYIFVFDLLCSASARLREHTFLLGIRCKTEWKKWETSKAKQNITTPTWQQYPFTR